MNNQAQRQSKAASMFAAIADGARNSKQKTHAKRMVDYQLAIDECKELERYFAQCKSELTSEKWAAEREKKKADDAKKAQKITDVQALFIERALKKGDEGLSAWGANMTVNTVHALAKKGHIQRVGERTAMDHWHHEYNKFTVTDLGKEVFLKHQAKKEGEAK